MDFLLSQDQRQLREQIIDFARAELNHDVGVRDREQLFPRELWRKCGEMGLQGLPVPEHYGGVGLDPLSTAIALEAFGYGCRDGGLVFSICAHLLACVVPIWRHGTDAQRERYLPDLATGAMIAVNAMTEPSSGSDAFTMETRAFRDDEGYRIRGTKTFSSNGPIADLAVVYADLDGADGPGGISAFLVEAGVGGFEAGQRFAKMGLRTAPISELVFDDILVPKESILGQPGAGRTVFVDSMDWERICIAAVHVGTMQRLLETAIEYGRTRTASGHLIGKFQAVSHQIADMKVRLDAAQLLTYRAASRLGVFRDVGLDASIVKLFVSESLVSNALATVRVLGGYGYMQEYEVERTLRDAVGGLLYSGTSEIQRNLIARWLGL